MLSGGVGILGAFGPHVAVTRPNDTTPYTAGDVVGGAFNFPFLVPFGANLRFISAFLRILRTSIPAGEAGYTLHLYSNKPPSQLADNIAFTVSVADGPFYIGSIDFAAVADLGSIVYQDVENLQMQRKLVQAAPTNAPENEQGTFLWAYLVTVVGYTPEALTVHHISVNGRYW